MPDDPTQPLKSPQFQVRIPLEWQDREDVPLVYANQVLVQHMGPEFFVVFGVVTPPTTTDQLPDSLKIRPQVRVAISRDMMPSIVQALQDSLQRARTQAQQGQGQQGQQGSLPPGQTPSGQGSAESPSG